jgi:hypothetical protein
MRVVTQQQLSISHGDFYHPEPSLALKDEKTAVVAVLGYQLHHRRTSISSAEMHACRSTQTREGLKHDRIVHR